MSVPVTAYFDTTLQNASICDKLSLMRDGEFEWDDVKAAINVADHGVTFWLARTAFYDPRAWEEPDPDLDEARYNRICRTVVGDVDHVLVITYTERDTRWSEREEFDENGSDDELVSDLRIRIISARRANHHERDKYFDPRRPRPV